MQRSTPTWKYGLGPRRPRHAGYETLLNRYQLDSADQHNNSIVDQVEVVAKEVILHRYELDNLQQDERMLIVKESKSMGSPVKSRTT